MTTLLEQVDQSRIAYLAACDAAAGLAVEYAEAEMHVGSNEQERKAAAKRLSPEEYEGWQTQLAAVRGPKAAAIAYRDRCEKDYNGLRDMLNRETADVQRQTAEIERETAVQQANTADVYARMAGTRTTMLEIRNRYPVAVPVTVDSEIPF